MDVSSTFNKQITKKNDNSIYMSVRVILRNEKLYRELVHLPKPYFSIQILLISIVKFTRSDNTSLKHIIMKDDIRILF